MKRKEKIFQLVLLLILFLLCLFIIVPFWLVVSVSLSNEKDVMENGYSFLIRNLDFSAYKYVFDNPKMIINAYKVTFIYSTVSMFLAVLLMAMLAYPLSVKRFRWGRQVSLYIYFTMLFSGGLVPSYILITQYLRLGNTIWVYILPGLISPWYVFVMRTFFQGIPMEITESAFMDGANDYIIFARFILPLSKPVLATVALFIFLGKWNDWYTALLYIDKDELISLQYLLQRILKNIELIRQNEYAARTINVEDIPSETANMAMTIIVAGPALVVFPFFQKYFVRGLIVGSVKG